MTYQIPVFANGARGSAAFFFVFFNPIKYVDPDGRDDAYYDHSGNYLETVASETTDIYARQTNGETVTNTRVGSVSEFNALTAAVVGESSGNVEESNAIADVIANRANSTGRAISDIVQNTGIYGYASSVGRANNGATSNTDANLVTARAASIDALIGNTDSSNGAYFWEGSTFITPVSSNYNANNWFVTSGWGTTPGTLSGIINYLETATVGGTIFMRNNPAYHGTRNYP